MCGFVSFYFKMSYTAVQRQFLIKYCDNKVYKPYIVDNIYQYELSHVITKYLSPQSHPDILRVTHDIDTCKILVLVRRYSNSVRRHIHRTVVLPRIIQPEDLEIATHNFEDVL